MTFNRWLYIYFPRLRKQLTKITYAYISYLDKDSILTFMNYGYTDLDPEAEPLKLLPSDEINRYEIQLYHKVASQVNWRGLDALEVSSGRGGGARYIYDCFHPKSLIGLDLSRMEINFCNRYYRVDGLTFLQGDAEALQFPDHSFDIVLNIEASLYYPHIKQFLSHVKRVLRPGGYFLYADLRQPDELDRWREEISNAGLCILREEDITSNVIQALFLDKARRVSLLQKYTPRLIQKSFARFAGISDMHSSPTKDWIGGRTYLSFLIGK